MLQVIHSGDMTDNWEHQGVSLERGPTGLGFSIASSNFLFNTEPVIISSIVLAGPADRDGRLRLGDIITHVNNVCITDAPHSFATEVLKRAGQTVHLTVKRRQGSILW